MVCAISLASLWNQRCTIGTGSHLQKAVKLYLRSLIVVHTTRTGDFAVLASVRRKTKHVVTKGRSAMAASMMLFSVRNAIFQ